MNKKEALKFMEKDLFTRIIREGGVLISEEIKEVRNMFPCCVTSHFGDIELELVLIHLMLNISDKLNAQGQKLYSITIPGYSITYTTDKEFLKELKESMANIQNVVMIDNINL